MKRFQERLDEVEVNSYKDCVWYLEEEDKCKLCNFDAVRFPCHCKEEMDDFCIWITKFFKSSPEETETNDNDSDISEPYLSLDLDNGVENVDQESISLIKTLMDALK